MRREAHRRLVEQQQLRDGHQRAADRQHLLLAAGQRAPGLLLALLEDGEEREDPVNVLREPSLSLRAIRAHLEVLRTLMRGKMPAPFRRLARPRLDDLVGGPSLSMCSPLNVIDPSTAACSPEIVLSVVVFRRRWRRSA